MEHKYRENGDETEAVDFSNDPSRARDSAEPFEQPLIEMLQSQKHANPTRFSSSIARPTLTESETGTQVNWLIDRAS